MVNSLIPHLDALYDETKKGHKERTNFLKWQKKTRQALRKTLIVPDLTITKVQRVRAFSIEEGEVSVLDCTLSDKTVMRVYVGRSKNGPSKPRAVIVYHGHSDGAQTLFGIKMTMPHQGYALEFLRKGYCVIAPDQRGFGERLGPSPIEFRGYTRSCRQLSLDLMMMGRTLLGERVADGMALVSFVKKMKDVDASRVVVTGNSGGGTTSLFHAALDTRVDAAMVSGAFCEYKHSIMELSHCECNYVPNILNVVKEIDEVGALIAPRRLLVIHGKKDRIFPITSSQRAFTRLKAGWQKGILLPELHVHGEGHQYHHGKVFHFLDALYAA